MNVDATIVSHKSVMEKLIKAAKNLYPKATFIKFDFTNN